MNADKQKALEAAGWKFGSADDFLGERPMSDSDKMRAEFEAWASQYGFELRRLNAGYWCNETGSLWNTWKAAYQAGRKAERELGPDECQCGKCAVSRAIKEMVEVMDKPEGNNERG